jgi:hypothetical protein
MNLDARPDTVPPGDVLALLLGMLTLGCGAVAETLGFGLLALVSTVLTSAPLGLLAVHERRAQRWWAFEQELSSTQAAADGDPGPG